MSNARNLPKHLEGYGVVRDEDEVEMSSSRCERGGLRDAPKPNCNQRRKATSNGGFESHAREIDLETERQKDL